MKQMKKHTMKRKSLPIPKTAIRQSLNTKKPLPKKYTKGKKLPFVYSGFATISGKQDMSGKKLDSKRKAMAPGIRVSKTGRVYPENRKNRTDRRVWL